MLPYERWIGGTAAHLQTYAGELGPAAAAQRKEFKKAQERMRTGAFGFTEGQRQGAAKVGRQGIAAQQASQQADLARAQAGGLVTGGATSEAQRQIAQAGQNAQGQLEADVQAASDASAQNQYARDRATIDAQAQRWRDLWNKQADISMQTTGAGSGGGGSYGGGSPQGDPRLDEVPASETGQARKKSTMTYDSVGS